MFVKNFKTNTILNITPINEDGYVRTNPYANIKGYKSDSLALKNKVNPPKISNIELFLGQISDDQIEQINKSRKLPQNARFQIVYTTGGRGGLLTEPFYEINLYIPFVPTLNKETRILPEGYEVIKNAKNSGKVGAVKIKKRSEGIA